MEQNVIYVKLAALNSDGVLEENYVPMDALNRMLKFQILQEIPEKLNSGETLVWDDENKKYRGYNLRDFMAEVYEWDTTAVEKKADDAAYKTMALEAYLADILNILKVKKKFNIEKWLNDAYEVDKKARHAIVADNHVAGLDVDALLELTKDMDDEDV